MSEQTKKYKDTIILPKTDFPMKASLPIREPKIIEQWDSQKTYQQIIKQNNDKPLFVMPDGPPYANGSLHLGHVLNKVLKDIIIKYKNMSGKKAAFIPGWDCHGLPIELNVSKKLGSKIKDMSPNEIRALCRKEALKWVEIQKEQFRRLGILAEWDNPYLTLNPNYEADEVRTFAKIFENGTLYRGKKPVYWCPTLKTALAASEIEYKDHKSPSVYVKFNLDTKNTKLDKLAPYENLSLVIWTTTPWTLPANSGIAVHPDFEYGVYKAENEYFIIAKELKQSVEQQCQIELVEQTTLKGSELNGLKASHPFIDNRTSLVVLANYVTLDSGTGCVHTAPGHGIDDYQTGIKNNLPILSPVNGGGVYTSEFPAMEGVHIWKANPMIVELLKSSGHLLGHKDIIHSYPHNPRSGTPLIFRSTPQWFIKMDDEQFNLRAKALKACEDDIHFVPDWGSQRLKAMVESSPDWCLSRQRFWGVPIPVYFCTQCEEPLLDAKIMNQLADDMEQSGKGIESYYSHEPSVFTEGMKCTKCNHDEFKRSEDILDVWFDSGVCHTAVQKRRKDLAFPADIYLEGSDQHRGWFQTSLMSSLAAYDQAPYKALITHGFVNDSKGHKMSKSKGNVIDPAKVIQQYGAEVLRLWVGYEDYGQDLTIGDEIFKRITEMYRRIRNTTRFILGNLNDFDAKTDQVAFNNMPVLDQWAIIRLNELKKLVTDNYEAYSFYKASHAINQFYTVDLSSIYLDIIKDRLYTWKKDGLHRRSTQTVLFNLLTDLTKMMAPILSFLAEETYNYFPEKKFNSVFLEPFPSYDPDIKNEQLSEDFTHLIELRSEVSKKLEELRTNKTIGSSLDAAVEITLDAEQFDRAKKYEESLKEILIVSKMTLIKGDQLGITTKKATGEKCPRCWHYFEPSPSQEICTKCTEALS